MSSIQSFMQNPSDLEVLIKTFNDLPVGVGIFEVSDLNDNKSIRYVFMNKVILYEMRKEREEVFGKKIIEVAPEAYEHEGGLQVIETYRKVAAEGGSVNLGIVEYSNHMVAGTYECSVHHIKDNYVYVMLRNVTELEQTKDKLEAKNTELSQLTNMVSHDLKAPLNNISGILQMIKEGYENQFGSDVHELFDLINDSAERMRMVITDLLDYCVVGQGKKELTTVDCEKLIGDIQKDLASSIKETNTTFEIGKLPKIRGFETELRLLFQNLINNAIKFRESGVSPKISIFAKEVDGWTFYIQDNGIGIADRNKDKIFTIFKRLNSTNKYEGTGIGLAHCKKIVDLHKGNIGVLSNDSNGSTFYFSIPNQQ